jgi:hypothetical protein
MEYLSHQQNKQLFLIRKTRGGNVSKRITKGRWTQEEHRAFMKACLKYGCNWKEVNFINLDS